MEFLKPVLPIILHHHEKYDGSGYPSGLKKEQIPLGARIIAGVDAFEAMVQGRPYRSSLSVDAALDELVKYSGTQFDPKVVNAFVSLASQKKFRKLLSLLGICRWAARCGIGLTILITAILERGRGTKDSIY